MLWRNAYQRLLRLIRSKLRLIGQMAQQRLTGL